MNFENLKNEPKTENTMIRVKTEPNGDYRLVSEDEFKKMEEDQSNGLLHIYESYEFKDVKEDADGKMTGVNYGGDRIEI
jgi:hypothetical protein